MAGAFTVDATKGPARAGELRTRHGALPTPLFLPVATLGTVKTLPWDRVKATGSRAVIMNAFLLSERPGLERITDGIHDFTGWDCGIFCDSCGFQTG